MRATRWVGGLGCLVWLGSWYLMYLEVTRWHHVTPSLAFNSDLGPDAHPGQALILLYAACVAAPLAVLATVLTALVRRQRSRRP
jgi:hypothetical protein